MAGGGSEERLKILQFNCPALMDLGIAADRLVSVVGRRGNEERMCVCVWRGLCGKLSQPRIEYQLACSLHVVSAGCP